MESSHTPLNSHCEKPITLKLVDDTGATLEVERDAGTLELYLANDSFFHMTATHLGKLLEFAIGEFFLKDAPKRKVRKASSGPYDAGAIRRGRGKL